MKKQDDEQVVDDQKVEDQQLDENMDNTQEGMDINDQEEAQITEEEQDLLGDLQRVQADFVILLRRSGCRRSYFFLQFLKLQTLNLNFNLFFFR